MFMQRKGPHGVLIPEAGDTAWADHYYRAQYLAGVLFKALAGRSRLLAGSWDGADLTGVVAEFFDSATGQLSAEAKTDLPALVIPATPTLLYAKKGLAALQSVALEVFNNSSWPEDQVPVLVMGHYQNTATTTAPFAEFVGTMMDPRASRGEKDLIINGGARTAQYDSYPLGAGCVGRGNRQFGEVDRLAFFTTQTATAGTADQNPLSNLSGGYSARLNNVSLPAGGKLHRLYRMEAKDAALLKGGQLSLAFESLHNAGADKTVTLKLSYADVADDFSAVTLIGTDGGQAHPSGALKLQGLDGFDLSGVPVQNGLEIELELDCGAVAGLTWEVGALRAHRRRTALPELHLPGVRAELADCLRYFRRISNRVHDGSSLINTYRAVGSGNSNSGGTATVANIFIPNLVKMRAAIDVSLSGAIHWQLDGNQNPWVVSNLSINGWYPGDDGFTLLLNHAGFANPASVILRADAAYSATIDINAEL